MAATTENVLLLIAGLAALAIVAIVALALVESTPSLREMLVGVATDPQLVGLVRALLAYVLPIAAGAAVAYLGDVRDPRLLPLVPILIGAIRIIEARLDQAAKPAMNRHDPPPVAGSGRGNPAR